MKDLIDIALCLIGAVITASVMDNRLRNRLIPLSFSFLLFWNGGGTIFVGMMNVLLYQICWLLNIIAMSVLLGSLRLIYFRKNTVWVWFFVFTGWWLIAGLLGDKATLPEVIIAYFRIVRMVIVGFVVASWAMERPEGFKIVLKEATIAAFLAALLYARYGSWSNAAALEDMGGRMVVNTSELSGDAGQIRGAFNVNRFALLTTMLLPYPFLLALSGWRFKRDKLYLAMAVFAVVVLFVTDIRTGSRNGGLGLFALAWYFIFAKTRLSVGKKIALMSVLGLVMVGLVIKLMAGNELRIFKFINENEETFEQMGTGRGSMFMSGWTAMTPAQHITGRGIQYYVSDAGRFYENCHSMYFAILLQSGIVGATLLVVFALSLFFSSSRIGPRGKVAKLFLFVWLFTGVGEGANFAPSSGYAKYGLGIAIALCSRRRNIYDPFDSRQMTSVRMGHLGYGR